MRRLILVVVEVLIAFGVLRAVASGKTARPSQYQAVVTIHLMPSPAKNTAFFRLTYGLGNSENEDGVSFIVSMDSRIRLTNYLLSHNGEAIVFYLHDGAEGKDASR